MRFRRLQLRFLLVVLASAALFAGVAGTATYQLAYQESIEDGRRTLDALATAVERTAAIGAYSGDRGVMQEVVDGLARNHLVAAAHLQPLGGALVHQAGVRLQPAASASARLVLERALSSPFDAKETIGQLRIEADMAELRATAASQASTLTALMVSQVALIALVLYVAASRLVSRPIVQLATRLRAMQAGTGDRLATPARHVADEIGMLIRSANTLLETNDVTLERERQLRAGVEALEAQYRQIFDSTSAAIFVLDGHRRLISGNPTLLKVIDLPLAQAQTLSGGDFLRHVFAHPERVETMIETALQRGETASADLALSSSHSTARWVHCLISARRAEGVASAGPAGWIEGVMYDVTERRRAEHAVRHLAEHDTLTGLKNRAASEAAIESMLNEAMRNDGWFTLLYIDLDGFKQVNDSFGHAAGDQVLVRCAEHLRQAGRRSGDLVGRLGGDEFVVALYGSRPDDPHVAQLAGDLVRALCQPLRLPGGEARIGASIGIACYPLHGRTARALSISADDALYAVKRSGKNGYAFAVPQVHAKAATAAAVG
ncbi:diguanylate cyclase domain-containing protein [Caldimonas brevitalea]|uniref:Diguanylate cyclase/phosphodiesterase n=1 Tax=Caldimonas brevitalea TaxID=413882 RepID=A0A0G3BR19_9BURK|nr:diguanylate cyclase [Caldimonas brevitalea]AKJ29791.1 diguanylate cyclase/phosphodiesterase [Caldimonas brevitalea]